MFKKIRDLLLPAECAVCGSDTTGSGADGVCRVCLADIDILNLRGCNFCGRPLLKEKKFCSHCTELATSTDGIYTAAYYKDNIKDIIKAFKYGGKKYLVNYLGELIFGLYREFLPDAVIDRLIYMPMHRVKKRSRGYNQAELLSDYLSGKTGIKKTGRYLKRVKNTAPQYNLSRKERLENLSEAFKASKKAREKNIILIDDVATTGATIQSAARELKKKGASRIYALVAAHGK